ncbi:Molybdenum ABC transporter, periplasmic molybdenum-binding protein ModA [Minicystis rosea]|nr:Molybdenum ABC transporter, periplasmic molybdenum-binding protein ModA [Minicystis rosea]
MNRRRWLAAVAVTALGACKEAPPATREITIAAAASLRAVLPELARVHQAAHPGVRITMTYGSSGDLQKQVEGGAPVDAVMFASGKPVDALVASGRAERPSRRVIATNELVLIGPKGGRPLTFATLDSLASGEMLAVGDPGAVPAGQYARDYLTSLGKWSALTGKLVLGGDVAAVLAYARRGEVTAAIVYRTEIRGISEVVVLDTARGPSAPRPEVVAAVVSAARAAGEAGAFLAFVASAEGQKILADFGFGPP